MKQAIIAMLVISILAAISVSAVPQLGTTTESGCTGPPDCICLSTDTCIEWKEDCLGKGDNCGDFICDKVTTELICTPYPEPNTNSTEICVNVTTCAAYYQNCTDIPAECYWRIIQTGPDTEEQFWSCPPGFTTVCYGDPVCTENETHQECTPVDKCGDGIKNLQEECDGTDGVGLHQTCTADCQLVNEPYCGDGIINNGETCETNSDCDDGSLNSLDKCKSDCSCDWSSKPVKPCENIVAWTTCADEALEPVMPIQPGYEGTIWGNCIGSPKWTSNIEIERVITHATFMDGSGISVTEEFPGGTSGQLPYIHGTAKLYGQITLCGFDKKTCYTCKNSKLKEKKVKFNEECPTGYYDQPINCNGGTNNGGGGGDNTGVPVFPGITIGFAVIGAGLGIAMLRKK